MKGQFTAAVLLLTAFLFGCGDNAGSPTGYSPIGTEDGALLLLDVQPATADSSEVVVYGEIFDPSSANGFRLYIDPAGQGYRPAADYLAAPSKTFSTGVNAYRIRSLDFDTTVDNVFVGRGARNGLETTVAPLTEHAAVYKDFAPLDLARRVDVPLVAPVDSVMTDSIPTLSWSAVPNAARYRLHIEGRNGIVYYVLTGATTHTVGSGQAIVLEDIPMRGGLLYRWGVEAIDVNNRLIGTTTRTRALLVQ
jgi:hypothetical protein